ncbi:hypothetical protein HPP92_007250 [Vanilla planifolia]|uniref:Uncharacterized protein n=1 Tax=Vanilla planifolia TaxID=51239 RepID=A0A835V5Q1_VANPL|nr:hypothetical protein HPP92_007250 [Vanilla planifolia]
MGLQPMVLLDWKRVVTLLGCQRAICGRMRRCFAQRTWARFPIIENFLLQTVSLGIGTKVKAA